MADSICLPKTMARQTFYAHAKGLYKLMDEFVRQNMVLVHKAVKDFVLRNGLGGEETIKGRNLVRIIMITDGTYDSMGYNASHGGSFAFERYTGAPLAIMVAEKCRTCKDRDVYKYHSTCCHMHPS